MPAMGMLQRAAVVHTQMVEPPLVNMASSMVPESRKYTLEETPIHMRKLVGDSTLKEKYLWRTHGIIGIGLKRNLELRLLL